MGGVGTFWATFWASRAPPRRVLIAMPFLATAISVAAQMLLAITATALLSFMLSWHRGGRKGGLVLFFALMWASTVHRLTCHGSGEYFDQMSPMALRRGRVPTGKITDDYFSMDTVTELKYR